MGEDQNANLRRIIAERYAKLDTETPLALLPYRIETRFSLKRDRLRIRIFPDQIHIDSHTPGLTEREVVLGQAFWLRTWSAPDDEAEREAAWVELTDTLGTRRAAWVARALRPQQTPSPKDLKGDTRKLFPDVEKGVPEPARARLLPDHWWVHGYLNGNLLLEEVVQTAQASLIVGPDFSDPDDIPEDRPPLSKGMNWMVDFDDALKYGMAFDISLTGKYKKIANQGLDLLFVFGLRFQQRDMDDAEGLARLMEAHLYTDGAAFVPRDTPTNNTAGVAAGWSPGDDLVGMYDREFGEPVKQSESAADELIAALGMPPDAALTRMQHAELNENAAAAMIESLWPITGRIYLETMIRGENMVPVTDSAIDEVRDWLFSYVRGGGPLAALRVGAIPYGILPVQYINGEYEASTKYRYIERVIGQLRQTWAASSEDVPRLVPLISRTGGKYANDTGPDDPETEILTIFSSQANADQYSIRRLPLDYHDTAFGVTSAFNFIIGLMGLLQEPPGLDRVLERELEEEWVTTIEGQIGAIEEARAYAQRDVDIWRDMLDGRIPLVGTRAEVQARYDYLTGPYGTLYWFDSILLPFLNDHLLRTEPLREVGLNAYPTGKIGDDDPALFYSNYDEDTTQWPYDAAIIEATAGNAAVYLEWLRQYALALVYGQPEPAPLTNLQQPPPLLYQLLKESIDLTAEREASPYGLFMGMANALTRREGFKSPQGDHAARIEAVRAVAARSTPAQLRQFGNAVNLTKTTYRNRAVGQAISAIPLANLRQLANDVEAAGAISTLGQARRDELGHITNALFDIADWREKQGITAGDANWWRTIPGRFPRPGALSLESLAQALAILRDTPAERLTHLLPETLGLFGHRLDAWATSLAYERLLQMRQKNPQSLVVGGFAWVENLMPAESPPSQGYVLAPSLTHAATAAILRSGWSTHGTPEANSLLATNLRSDRVRLAASLLDGMRQGQAIEDLLGYYFERLLMGDGKLADGSPASGGKHVWIDPLRKAFGGGTVVDGLALVDAREAGTVTQRVQNPPGSFSEILQEVDAAVAAFDAVGDLLMAESVHHLVQGNMDRASAALDTAASGEVLPPELQVIQTPAPGTGVDHRVFVLLTGQSWPQAENSPRAKAAAALDGWLSELFGPPEQIRCRVTMRGEKAVSAVISIADLDLSALDLVMTAPQTGTLETSQWAALVRYYSLLKLADPVGTTVEIDFTDAASGTRSFDDACTLALTLRQLLAESRALDGLDFMTATDEALRGVDIGELDDRVAVAVMGLEQAIRSVEDEATAQNRSQILVGLQTLAAFDLPGALPDLSVEFDLDQHVAVALDQAAQHLSPLIKIEDGTTLESWYTVLRTRLQVVFGKAFPVIPQFNVPAALSLPAAFQHPRADDATVAGWLARVSLVQRGAAALHETVLVSDALDDATALGFTATQIPFDPSEGWVAMEAPKPETGGRVALTACVRAGVNPAAVLASGHISGLLVERWLESIPYDEQTAGLTFHYDSPAQRPPQSILLAVPPHGEQWSLDLFVNTLLDTRDWVSLRAVAPETLRRFGHHLPAVFLDNPPDFGEQGEA